MRRAALVMILLSAVAIGVAYASALLPGGAAAWAPWLLAFGTATILVSAMVLGASRDRHAGIGMLALPFLFTYVVIAGGFALALGLPEGDPASPQLWLGLPRRAAIILYGIGLLPAFVLPLAYALTFDRTTLPPDDWRRVRDAARSVRPADAAAQLHAQPEDVVSRAPLQRGSGDDAARERG